MINPTNKSESIFRISAHNPAVESENKIHDDRVATAYGFRGGLVPGVTVYGYMVAAILEQFGRNWIARGSANIRFHAACYDGDRVVTRCTESAVSAEREDGLVFASGTVSQERELVAVAYAVHEAPVPEHRPEASPETIKTGLPLGTIREILDAQDEPAIPERLLHLANEILVRNFRMSPWIHAGSHITHHSLTVPGQQIEVTGVIQECFERKGRSFAVAGLAMCANGKAVAGVRHTFIYKLNR